MTEQDADRGLRRALAELLPDLRAFARFLAGSRSEADDLVQEALARTLASLDGRAEGVALRPWCLGVIRNVYHEQHRRRRREAAVPVIEAEPQSPADQELPAAMRDLGAALARLPPRLREALVLVGAQGLPYEEAAGVCNVPVGTMKARVSRARRLLSDALDGVNK